MHLEEEGKKKEVDYYLACPSNIPKHFEAWPVGENSCSAGKWSCTILKLLAYMNVCQWQGSPFDWLPHLQTCIVFYCVWRRQWQPAWSRTRDDNWTNDVTPFEIQPIHNHNLTRGVEIHASTCVRLWLHHTPNGTTCVVTFAFLAVFSRSISPTSLFCSFMCWARLRLFDPTQI